MSKAVSFKVDDGAVKEEGEESSPVSSTEAEPLKVNADPLETAAPKPESSEPQTQPQTQPQEAEPTVTEKVEEKRATSTESPPNTGSSLPSAMKRRDATSPTTVPDHDVYRFKQKTSLHQPRFVKCSDCGDEIPIDEWPNHRDRLRKVQIRKKIAGMQMYCAGLFVDAFMWLLVNVYFREVAVCGLENVPKEGPVVFYGNHQNQFIDAMMIRAHCGRPVRFIIAEKSLHRPIIGHFARLMEAVPVVRPQDVKSTEGVGQLVSMEGNRVTGKGTTFTKGMTRGDVISWSTPSKPICTGQVLSIESDSQLSLTLFVKPEDVIAGPTSFKCSRRIDHSEMYAEVYNTLADGHCIGIFPEGGSHDRTSLIPLKAGVALFSLGAAERGIQSKIVPCGLTYFFGHRFRSRAHIEFGEPIMPSDDLIAKFQQNELKREATGDFLKVLDKNLRSVTINVPDWASLKFLHAFRRLYQPPNVKLDTGDYLRLTRRLSRIINNQDDDPKFADFRTRVENYNDYCAALMVRDSQAATLAKLEDASVGLLIRRLVLLFVMGVALVPFLCIALPIGVITHFAAEAHAKTALRGSDVKVVAADVKSSYKILTSFATVPLVMNSVATAVWYFCDLRTALTVFFSLPMASYVSLLIAREFVLEFNATTPLIISMFSKHKQFRKLFERRTQLAEEAKAQVSRFDPSLERELEDLVEEGEDELRQPSLFSLRHSSRKPQQRGSL